MPKWPPIISQIKPNRFSVKRLKLQLQVSHNVNDKLFNAAQPVPAWVEEPVSLVRLEHIKSIFLKSVHELLNIYDVHENGILFKIRQL